MRPRPYRRSRPPVIYERRGEFPANAGGVRKNNRCDIFARLKRGRSPVVSLRIIATPRSYRPRRRHDRLNQSKMTQPRHWRYRNACRSSRITLQTFRSWAGSTTRARRFMPNNATSKTINAALLKRFGAEFEIDPDLTGLNELEK